MTRKFCVCQLVDNPRRSCHPTFALLYLRHHNDFVGVTPCTPIGDDLPEGSQSVPTLDPEILPPRGSATSSVQVTLSRLTNPVEVTPLVRERGSDTPLAGRCGSPLRNKPGRYCIKDPLRGKTRCQLHGGKSPSGIAHYNFKHGMYSTVLAGTALGLHYQQARANPALVQLTEQIALVDARVYELFAKMTAGESLTAWTRITTATAALETAFEALREAQKTRDVATMMTSLNGIGDALAALQAAKTSGESDLETWEEIRAQIYLRKKLVDSEGKRRKDAQEMVMKDQVLGMLGLMAQSILRHVPDPRQRQAVVDDMRLLTAGPRA